MKLAVKGSYITKKKHVRESGLENQGSIRGRRSMEGWYGGGGGTTVITPFCSTELLSNLICQHAKGHCIKGTACL